MIKDEKISVLSEYCDATDCMDCLLVNRKWTHNEKVSLGHCLSFAKADEEELDKALDLIGYVEESTVNKKVDEIEVKRDALKHYCGNNECKDCVLVNHEWDNVITNIYGKKCLHIDYANDDEVLHAYDLICRSYAPIESVNHPKHYNKGTIEVIDYIEDQNLGFHLGNAIKYISRAGDKDPDKIDEDIRKAIWYLERYRDLIKKGKSNND